MKPLGTGETISRNHVKRLKFFINNIFVAYNSLLENGFYSSYNSKFNLRIIVLNTQTCDTINFFLLKNPTDPNKILSWLRDELYIAEKHNQSVYIIGHIPPANSFCLSEWAQRYTVLIERFENTVKGQFFGHTHQDHYESVRSLVDGHTVGTVFIAPSLTTYGTPIFI
jgi:sphingomyelin phosphodiesterase